MVAHAIPTTAIGRRYGVSAEKEWDRVRSHFALNAGFSLVVLIVPDRDGAALCLRVLADDLRGRGQDVLDISPPSPSALRQLAPLLLAQAPPSDCGALWLAAAVPEAAEDHAAWQMAWRWGLATVNQNRNPLRRHLDRTLVIVGVPALVPLFREAAPDLWSIRDLVAHIEPEPGPMPTAALGVERRLAERRPSDRPIPDLDLALAAIERLRGVTGQERDLATMVERAAQAYAGRGNAAAAEACFREALDLRDRFDAAPAIAGTLLNLGDNLLDQARATEAETVFRRAVSLAADHPGLRATAMDMLAHALLAQGRPGKAEAMFRQALRLAETAGASAVSRGVSTDMLGRAILAQGRAAEAELVFRRALALVEAGGASAVSRAITWEMLAHAVLAQGRAAEAEAQVRQALVLAETGGASAVSRAITARMLAQAILAQGRAAEAETQYRAAVALAREGGAPADLLRLLAEERDAVIHARDALTR
jgi:tetratricopeptide (TPR) repeat protein